MLISRVSVMSVSVWMCETCAVCMYEDVPTNAKMVGWREGKNCCHQLPFMQASPLRPNDPQVCSSGNRLPTEEDIKTANQEGVPTPLCRELTTPPKPSGS